MQNKDIAIEEAHRSGKAMFTASTQRNSWVILQ